jgi:hypothetical protein
MFKTLLTTVATIIGLTSASHWRFGQCSWKQTTGTTVEFTCEYGWRSTFIGSNYFNFGDGTGQSLSGGYTLLSTGTDSYGNGWALVRYIFTHTYAGEGPYVATIQSCCRIGQLDVGSNDYWRMEYTIDMTNGNTGGPVSAISPLLQFTMGQPNSIPLSPVDNDGDTVTCRQATAAESKINDADSLTFYSVSSDCVISISQAAEYYNLWAAQIMMETANGDSNPIDFIFEGTTATLNNAPVCSLDLAIPVEGYFSVDEGDLLEIGLTGTDSDAGDTLTFNPVSLPAGSSFSGPIGASPISGKFSWTPSPGQDGSYSASFQVVDSSSATSLCIIPIRVTEVNTPPPTPAPTCAELVLTCDFHDHEEVDGNCEFEMEDLTHHALASGGCGALSMTQSPALGTILGVGEHTVSVTVTDGQGNTKICSEEIHVEDVTPPSIICSDTVFEWSVDGSCQYELGSCAGAVTTSDNCGLPTVTQTPVIGTLFGLGDQVVTMISIDSSGNSASCDLSAKVIDDTPPVIHEATADPNELWPPNHKWGYVELYLDASDNCAGDMEYGTLTCNVTSVTLDEVPKWDPNAKRPKSAHCGLGWPTYEIIDDLMVKLCRERNDDSDDGRTYTMSGNCHDDEGNWAPYSTSALVPHSQGE